MCGIAGIITANARSFEPDVQAMNARQRHRGPGGEGVWSSEQCVFGHVRLSVVDLEGGAQPFVSGDESVALTFNGEVYGYQEMRARLDYPFRTRSDTEVILALYAKHGATMPCHLPGMFAFVLWDEQRSTLLCARDRFGEKPFFDGGALGRLARRGDYKTWILLTLSIWLEQARKVSA